MAKKTRPVMEILLEMEPLLEELIDKQDLQHGDVLALIWVWLTVHRPDAIEEYIEDGSSPEFYYGKRRK
jgi:hypothetical protein